MPELRRLSSRYAVLAVLAAAAVACSEAPPAKTPPPPKAATAEPEVGGAEDIADASAATEEAAEASAAFDAVTRPKITDDDYLSAIADMDGANGTTDAGTDLAAERRQVLGIPQENGWSRLPGSSLRREQLPEGVRVVRIQGLVEGTEDRHQLRYEMLTMKYAQDYNATMLRGLSVRK
jgi:hypothetical protein